MQRVWPTCPIEASALLLGVSRYMPVTCRPQQQAACRETAVFYRDRVEPSHRSRGERAREKKKSNGTLKEKTVENRPRGGGG